MKNRSPAAVFFFGLITLGIYSWYWAVKTKGEMNSLGEKVPTAWMWLIPFVGSLIWYWKYAQAVENVSNKNASTAVTFIVLVFLGCIGQAVVQGSFNKISPAAAASGYAPSTPGQSMASAAMPTQPTVAPAEPVMAPSQEQMSPDPAMQPPLPPAEQPAQPLAEMPTVQPEAEPSMDAQLPAQPDAPTEPTEMPSQDQAPTAQQPPVGS